MKLTSFASNERLKEFCLKWKIAKLELFGSALRDDFNSESDKDFLVTFEPESEWGLWEHIEMEGDLAELIGRKIDLISRRAVERSSNLSRRQRILNSAETVYVS